MTLLNLIPPKPVSSIEFLPPREPSAQPQTFSVQKDLIDLKDRAAYLEVKRFSRTARLLFGHDRTLLAYLGLGKRSLDSWPVANLPGVRPTALARSKAAIASRWRQMFINAQKLYTWELDQLAQAGWTVERLVRAVALVEAVVEAHHK